MGWVATLGELRQTQMRVAASTDRMRMINSQIDAIYATKQDSRNRGRGFLSGLVLDGSDFRDVQIDAGPSAFQSTSLRNANLENANIKAGGSSFQSVCFDEANLRGATLSASGASFQVVTFVNADMRGATLIGGSGSEFQNVSFRGADLTGATIRCGGSAAFAQVDIDSAVFYDSDLSRIDSKNLSSAFFTDPPKYDSLTKFPDGFDAGAVGWELAATVP